MKFKPLYLFICLFCLSACTETQLVSHVAKQIPGVSSKSEGSFKVGRPYKVFGKTYVPKETYDHTETGIASWYGPNFHGKKTANGEVFDMNELTAAHRTLQLPSLVRVTNLENGRSLVVRVNDRGPFKRGRIIDLSKRGAELLDFKGQGTAKVKVQVLSEESKAIAMAAKRGEDTRGIEVAMNENRLARSQTSRRPVSVPANESEPVTTTPKAAPTYEVASNAPVSSPAAIESETLAAPDIPPGHIKNGKFLPDPVVTQFPVKPTGIYVQAGSFGDAANANSFAQSLSSFGNAKVYPALVNGTQYYRVRIGPMENVSKADNILGNLARAGRGDAIIVVD